MRRAGATGGLQGRASGNASQNGGRQLPHAAACRRRQVHLHQPASVNATGYKVIVIRHVVDVGTCRALGTRVGQCGRADVVRGKPRARRAGARRAQSVCTGGTGEGRKRVGPAAGIWIIVAGAREGGVGSSRWGAEQGRSRGGYSSDAGRAARPEGSKGIGKRQGSQGEQSTCVRCRRGDRQGGGTPLVYTQRPAAR